MLSPEYQIIISPTHQIYLKILDTSINDGETVAWALIRKAYKKRALIVHPDKGGSEEAFKELNTAFQKLEHLIEHGTELELDGLAEMSSSLDEMLNELKAHFDRMNGSLDRMTVRLEHSFSKINESLDKLNTSIGELRTSTQRLVATRDDFSDSVDKMAASTKDLHANIQRLDDMFNIDIPFYLGCYTVFLGSVVSAINGKHQLQHARSMGAFLFGTGLIATGGYLIANSLFKKDKPTPTGEDNGQSTELKLVGGCGC